MPEKETTKENLINILIKDPSNKVSPINYENLLLEDDKRVQDQGIMPIRGTQTQFDPIILDEYKGTIGYKDNNLGVPVWHGTDFLKERRSQIQTVGNRVLKMFPRISAKFTSEVAKIPGYLGGAALAAGSGDIGDMVDNAWINSINQAEDYVKNELFPVYTPKSVQEGGLWKNITSSSFWATEGADGVGFLLSMLVPGAALKAGKVGVLGAKGINTLSKVGKLIKPGYQGIKLGERGISNLDNIAATTINTLFESASEAGETFDKVKNQLIASGWSEEDAKQKAGNAAVETLLANMAILIGPNALTQNQLFKAFNRTKGLNRLFGKSGELLTQANKRGFKESIPLFGKELFKSIASEGFFEEGLQFASSKYFEDEALGKVDDYDNYLEAVLGTYIDNIGNTDMQKSIFLGGILGGGMAAVSTRNQIKAEDRAISGDKGFTPNKFQKLLGLKERKESKGLLSLLENNYINRYNDFEQVYKKDTQGNYILNEQGDRIVDQAKLKNFKASLINNDIINLMQESAIKEGDELTFDFLKSVKDLQYMIPYFQQPEGMDLLQQHIESLAQKDAEYIKDILQKDNSLSTQEIKQELLTKAKKYKKIYDEIEANSNPIYNTINYKTEDQSKFQDFSEDLKRAKLNESFKQDFFRNKINELNSKKLVIETESLSESFITEEEKQQLEKINKEIKTLEDSFKDSLEVSKSLYNDKKQQELFNQYIDTHREIEEEIVSKEEKKIDKEEDIVNQDLFKQEIENELFNKLNQIQEKETIINNEEIVEKPELTQEEESFKSNIEAEAKGELNPDFITEDKQETTTQELKAADVILTEHDPNAEKVITPENTFEYLYTRVNKAFNKVAYLSRKYVDVISGNIVARQDISDKLNEEAFLPILNPNKYQADTSITLKLDDRFEVPMTDPSTGEETTWGAYKTVNNLEPKKSKKADIERRRQEVRGDVLERIGVDRVGFDGKQRQDWKDAKNQDLKIAINHAIERLSKNPNVKIASLPSAYANAIKAELEIHGVKTTDKTSISEIIEKLKEINAKYDAELAVLGDNIIEEEYSEDYVKHVPIAVVDTDGNTISFVHDTDWINENNVEDTKEGITKQVKELIKIRKYIVENKEVPTTITSKSFGVFFKAKDNSIKKVSEQMPDSNLVITYDRGSGILEDARGTTFKGTVVNKTTKGKTYTVVQVGLDANKKPLYMALPVLQNKVTPEIVNTLVAATKAWLIDDKNIIDKVYSATNEKLNIKSFKDLKDLYETFIYNYNPNIPFKDFIKNGNITNSKKYIIHLSGNSIDFGRPGVSKSHRFINKEGFTKLKPEEQQELLNKLSEYLTEQYFNTNGSLLQSDIIIPQIADNEVSVMFNGKYNDFVKQNTSTNIMGVEVEEGVYSYTIQPVIKFDDSFVNPKEEVKVEVVKDEEGTTAPKELFDINIEIDPEAFEGLDFDEDYLPKEKSSETLESTLNLYKEFTIKGLNLKLQSELISTIASSAYREAVKNKEVTLTDHYKKWFNTLTVAKNKSKKELTVKVLSLILDDWKKVTNLTTIYTAKLSKAKISDDLITNDDFIQEFERNSYEDNFTLTLDSKDTISTNLRKFFAFTEARNNDFTIKKNFLGLPAFEDFDTVYNTLHAILVNTAPNLGDMIKQLEETSSKLPWLTSVIENLEDADTTIKNQFVVDMTKHYVKMKKIMWAKKPIYKDKKLVRIDYQLILVDDNSNSIQQAITNNWYNNLKTSDLVTVTNGEYFLNEEAFKQITEEANNITTKEQLESWFNKVGIYLDPQVLDTVFEGKFKYGRKTLTLEQQINDKGGIIKSIKDSFEKSLTLNTPIEDNKSFTSETIIQSLANLEGQHSNVVLSNSHRSGGEIIYSYSVNKWFIDRFNALTKNIGQLQEKLSKVAFAKNSLWLEWLKSGNDNLSKMDYFYTSLEPLKQMDKPSRKNRDLTKLSDEEHELYKLGHFTYNVEVVIIAGKKYRKVNFLYPTMSDKSTSVGISTYSIIPEVDLNGNIQESVVDTLYNQLVQSEINRMAAHGKATINQKDYKKGLYNFYFLPKLNEIEGLIDNIKAGNYSLETFKPAIKQIIKDYVNTLVNQKLELWKDSGIGESNKETKEDFKFLNKEYLEKIAEGETEEAKLKFAATDMVANYMIANANIHALFLTDPANYFKKNLAETEINIGKRLAFDIAPGNTLADSDTNDYHQVFFKDPKRGSEEIEYYKSLFNDFRSDPYEEIEGADAQEFTTTKERLYVMLKRGAISQELHDKVVGVIDSQMDKDNFDYWNNIQESLTPEELTLFNNPKIWQPEKPVYTNQLIDETTGHERRIYIKSSAFPLIPILTKNMELDKVRIALEKFEFKNGKTVRAVFGTGTKLGYINSPIEIYNEDSTVKDFEVTEDNILELPRIGFRIQQDVPYDESKDAINRGSQEAKLLFTDLRDIATFEFGGEKDVKGSKLEEIYLKSYKELYQLKLRELEEELLVDGQLDVVKLGKLLLDEAKSRNYSLNDILGLNITNGEFDIPLWLSPSTYKYQSMLNSIVNNRIIKLKFPGRSFVLGTEEGFNGKTKIIGVGEGSKELRKYKGIIFTNKWEGYLKPANMKVGQPDQVLVSWKHKQKLEKFINNKGQLDVTKLDDDVLKLFGFRIPTQGLNSMTMIEIVGFLPPEAGDLIIAPRDFTKRMGSDFDVDKLYTYQYPTTIDEDGRIIVDRSTEENKLLSEILDVHFAVMSNPDPKVQKKISAALDFGLLKGEGGRDASDKIEAARNNANTNEFAPYSTIVSDEYQKKKFLSATAGKVLVGITSNLVVLNSVAQDKDLHFEDVTFKLGNMVSNGKLFGKRTFRNRFISIVAAAFQSAAVDNEKEQILSKINLNSTTSDCMIAMTAMGYDEDIIAAFLSQPIVEDYVKSLRKYTSSLQGYTANADQKAFDEVIEKYGKSDLKESLELSDLGDSTPDQVFGKLLSLIYSKEEPEFNKLQVGFLQKFRDLLQYGKMIGSLQTTVNTDSSGVPKNLFESSTKETAIKSLIDNPIINAEKLIGNYVEDTIEPTTINGFALVYGLFTANKLWSQYFQPYFSDSFNILFNEYSEVTKSGDSTISSISQDKKQLFEEVKSYIFTNQDSGIYDENIITERSRLFLDTETNQSLATILEAIKQLPYYQTNNFLNKITVVPNKNGLPSTVRFNASTGENFDESNIYLGALEMLASKNQPILGTYNGIEYTPKLLMQDLISYSYLSGGQQGAIDFTRYIPITYLIDSGFIGTMKEFNWNSPDYFGIASLEKDEQFIPSNFITQYAQSNGIELPQITMDDIISEVKDIKDLNSFRLSNQGLRKLVVDNNFPAFLSVYNPSIPKGGNKYSVFQHTVTRDNSGKQIDIYQKLDTLGTFGMLEYNFNGEGKTIIEQQKSPISYTTTDVKPQGIPVLTNTEKITETEKSGLSTVSGKEQVIKKLENLSLNSNNQYYSLLAGELLKAKNNIPSDIKLKVVKEFKARGAYNYDSNTITINTFDNTATKGELEKTFLHELIHGYTGKAAKVFEELGATKAIQQKLLTKDQVIQLVKLNNLKSQFVKKLIEAGKKEELEAFLKQFRENSSDLETIDINIYYGTTSLAEFITMAMTEPIFQDLLNDVTDKNKTFFDRFKEIVLSLLKSLGLDIKEDSILASTIESVIELVNVEQVENQQPIIKNNPSEYTNYSGAASGGDTDWKNEGQVFGIKQVDYRPQDLTKLSKEELQEVETAYQQAVKDLGRNPLASNTYAGGLVRRDYLQAKSGDAIFAISVIIEPGNKDKKGYINKTNHQIVEGGTGYAVQMAINLGKPVFVFDQTLNKWFKWQPSQDLFGDSKIGKFVETDIPILTKNFTGIGTREINELGKQAIKDVYEKTFKAIRKGLLTQQQVIQTIKPSKEELKDLQNRLDLILWKRIVDSKQFTTEVYPENEDSEEYRDIKESDLQEIKDKKRSLLDETGENSLSTKLEDEFMNIARGDKWASGIAYYNLESLLSEFFSDKLSVEDYKEGLKQKEKLEEVLPELKKYTRGPVKYSNREQKEIFEDSKIERIFNLDGYQGNGGAVAGFKLILGNRSLGYAMIDPSYSIRYITIYPEFEGFGLATKFINEIRKAAPDQEFSISLINNPQMFKIGNRLEGTKLSETKVKLPSYNNKPIKISFREEDLLIGDNIPQSYKDLWKSQKAEFIAKHNINLNKGTSLETFKRLVESAKKDKYNTLKLELDTQGKPMLRINMVKPTQTEINFEDLGESVGSFMKDLSKEERELFREAIKNGDLKTKCKE